jgi:hypothetical protein
VAGRKQKRNEPRKNNNQITLSEDAKSETNHLAERNREKLSSTFFFSKRMNSNSMCRETPSSVLLPKLPLDGPRTKETTREMQQANVLILPGMEEKKPSTRAQFTPGAIPVEDSAKPAVV